MKTFGCMVIWCGMSEWILDNVGSDGLLECSHPSTKGHQHFYKNIISDWIKI